MGNADGNAYSLCRWLAAAALACLSLTAHAVKWDRSTDYYWNVGNGNITAFPGQGTGNMWSSGSKVPTATGPQWTGAAKRLPFNPSPTANFKAKFSPASMAKGLVNPLNIITLVGAPVLSELFTQACLRLAGGSMELAPGGQWEQCTFGDTQVTRYKVTGAYSLATFHDTKGEAFSAWKANCDAGTGRDCFVGTNDGRGPGCFQDGPQSYEAAATGAPACTRVGSTVYSNLGPLGVATQLGTVQSQTGWGPATTAHVETKLTERLEAWTQADFLYGFESASGGKPSGGTGSVLDSIINSGTQLDAEVVAPTIQTPINEGPVTTTTTNPDGSTKTETKVTTNEYSCLVISNGEAVECKQYKTTTTTTASSSNPNGSGTVTTTATTVTTQETKPGDEVDQCAKYPESLGCAKLDASTEAIPARTETLTYAPENLGFGNGSCPAPYGWTDSLGTHAVNLAPFCDVLTSVVRPLVLAIAALMAVFIVLPRET